MKYELSHFAFCTFGRTLCSRHYPNICQRGGGGYDKTKFYLVDLTFNIDSVHSSNCGPP